MKRKKIIALAFVISLVVLLFFSWNDISQKVYLFKDNITSDVKKETNSYLNTPKEKDFLVYFYDTEQCDSCQTYIQELKKYEIQKESFPVYKVNLAKLPKGVVEDSLFMDSQNPYVLHIKDGEIFYNYIGTFASDKLPNKKQEYKPL